MSEKENKKEIAEELKQIKEELKGLRTSLNLANEEKEKAFSEKEEVKKQISKLIAQVREAKGERNKFTHDVKGAKKERNTLNKRIASKIKEIKTLNDKKKELESKFNIKVNPTNLKKQIEELELKVETEVLEFKKEKVIMKQINDLRKKFTKVKDVSEIWEESAKLSKEIDSLKTKANSLHNIVRGHAKESQEKHETLLESSVEIRELREKEETAYKTFFEFKQKYTELNNKIKEKLARLKDLGDRKGASRAKRKVEDEKKKAASIKEKIKAVEDKIKTGKKLTTEDFMVMQAAN